MRLLQKLVTSTLRIVVPALKEVHGKHVHGRVFIIAGTTVGL